MSCRSECKETLQDDYSKCICILEQPWQHWLHMGQVEGADDDPADLLGSVPSKTHLAVHDGRSIVLVVRLRDIVIVLH